MAIFTPRFVSVVIHILRLQLDFGQTSILTPEISGQIVIFLVFISTHTLMNHLSVIFGKIVRAIMAIIFRLFTDRPKAVKGKFRY